MRGGAWRLRGSSAHSSTQPDPECTILGEPELDRPVLPHDEPGPERWVKHPGIEVHRNPAMVLLAPIDGRQHRASTIEVNRGGHSGFDSLPARDGVEVLANRAGAVTDATAIRRVYSASDTEGKPLMIFSTTSSIKSASRSGAIGSNNAPSAQPRHTSSSARPSITSTASVPGA